MDSALTNPEAIALHRITHADVSSRAIVPLEFCQNAERARHVFLGPLSFLISIYKPRDLMCPADQFSVLRPRVFTVLWPHALLRGRGGHGAGSNHHFEKELVSRNTERERRNENLNGLLDFLVIYVR